MYMTNQLVGAVDMKGSDPILLLYPALDTRQ